MLECNLLHVLPANIFRVIQHIISVCLYFPQLGHFPVNFLSCLPTKRTKMALPSKVASFFKATPLRVDAYWFHLFSQWTLYGCIWTKMSIHVYQMPLIYVYEPSDPIHRWPVIISMDVCTNAIKGHIHNYWHRLEGIQDHPVLAMNPGFTPEYVDFIV